MLKHFEASASSFLYIFISAESFEVAFDEERKEKILEKT